jgi:hypothetical protein
MKESKNTDAPERVREPLLAGSWYPGDPVELRNTIEGYLAKCEDSISGGEILGLIVPHAGYAYSGPVAAWGYRQIIDSRYDLVVVLAPSHRAAFNGVSVFNGDAYRTPLGLVDVAGDVVDSLLANGDPFHFVQQAHMSEHSLEIQLPFLQVVLGEFELVPIVMGEQNPETCRAVADVLAEVLKGRNALIVASSDYSHYHDYNTAVRLDAVAFRYISAFDPEGLMDALSARRTEACGGGAIAVTLMATKSLGGETVEILNKANSGDITGDKDRVVGYMAAAVLKGVEPEKLERELTDEEKDLLLRIARRSITDAVEGRPRATWDVESPTLKEDRGAFVTIKTAGQLRGCIGHVVGIMPLWQTVQEVAESAALRDPRFPPVSPEELEDVEIEVSALTPLRAVEGIEEIEIGKHGLMIRDGGRSGLLLPQVASEYGWTPEKFVEQTCLKAGLPPNSWKSGAELFAFSAEVFGQND